ncbi:MAG: RsmE family RNA methyltransferase [Bacilli bacterium]
MQRYFIDNCDSIVKLDKKNDIYYHLTKVLRAKINDEVELCNSDGECFVYKIIYINSVEISFFKIIRISENNELPFRLILAVSLLKNNNFELVLQKAVELGVSEIVAFESKRTVINSSNFSSSKIDRFKKIILEAAQQSKRNCVPSFLCFYSLDDLKKFDCKYKLIAYEGINDVSNHHLINFCKKIDSDIMIIIGPEGGFSTEEVNYEIFIPVSLGKRILRAETAAISACNIIAANMESIGG